MSLRITYTYKCDLCGHQVENDDAINPPLWSMLVTGARMIATPELRTLICPKHAITATVNGDVVTVKGAEA